MRHKADLTVALRSRCAYLSGALLHLRRSTALEVAGSPHVLSVDERVVRHLPGNLAVGEVGDLVEGRFAVHNPSQPDVHGPVRVVKARPHVRVEIVVQGDEVVVRVAVRPHVHVFHSRAAHVAHAPRQVS